MSKIPDFYTRFTIPPDLPSQVGSYSLTSQEFAQDSNINNIIEKFFQTGYMPPPNSKAIYGDFSGDFDYTEYRNILNVADELFGNLPSKARDEYQNDPAVFFDAYSRDPNILNKYLNESDNEQSDIAVIPITPSSQEES